MSFAIVSELTFALLALACVCALRMRGYGLKDSLTCMSCIIEVAFILAYRCAGRALCLSGSLLVSNFYS